jgi:iron complex transport system substrate-binding protein
MNRLLKTFHLSLAFAIVCATLISACGSSVTVTPAPTSTVPPTQPAPTEPPVPTEEPMPAIMLEDGYDRQVGLSEPAQRILSIAPSSTEILYAIGAGGQMVGRDELSDYPPEALDLPSIGTTYGDLNTEAIVALEPDLVMAAMINSPEHVQAIEDLGIAVFVLPNPSVFTDLYDILKTAGVLAGREDEAEELAEALEVRVEVVLETVEDAEPVLVYYELDGTDPTAPWTTGPGTFQDVLITLAGGENVASEIEFWGQISAEAIVARDPAVIIFEEAPWVPTTAEMIAERVGWGDITAVVEGAVYGIDSNLTARPGPRYVDALERMAMLLHPDLFK